ncbi:MAG: hypothetical protein ACO1RA_07635 [Planctomycetaceae bacterium]
MADDPKKKQRSPATSFDPGEFFKKTMLESGAEMLQQFAQLRGEKVPSLEEAMKLTEATLRKASGPNKKETDYRSVKRFLPRAFRILPSDTPTAHRLGGQSPVAMSCGCCNAPMILFATLDTTVDGLSGKFPHKKLPLYYCLECPGTSYYHVQPNGNATPLRWPADEYEEQPFGCRRWQVPTGYLSLVEIPSEIQTLMEDLYLGYEVDETAKKQLEQPLKALIGERLDRWEWAGRFSQMGGLPLHSQGHNVIAEVCPNRLCPSKKRPKEDQKYCALAVLNMQLDEFWGYPDEFVDVAYNICPDCNLIAVKYVVG